jgi:BirA family transcriptional regulator, biotin operon repressor / biotin---[acetyl-CoA-carboxylase] ligase
MRELSGDLIRHKLPTRTFGQNVIHTPQTGSTNTELKQLARRGALEGTLYITEEQLVGRGRLKRDWFAPPGSSLLMSLLFRPGEIVPPAQAQRLTMLCALALADAVSMNTTIKPRLKWPNDLVWTDGKKLAGLLTEVEIEDNYLTWVVVGTGLNVNIDFNTYEPRHKAGNGDAPLSQTATSLSMILGRNTDDLRLPILQKYLFNIEQRYKALQQGWLPHEEWRDRLLGMGQTVTLVDFEGHKHQGVMADVEENGALVLQESDGSTRVYTAGDVSLRL